MKRALIAAVLALALPGAAWAGVEVSSPNRLNSPTITGSMTLNNQPLGGFFTDAIASSAGYFDSFFGSGVTTGTCATIDAEANHPGICTVTSSTSANSGFRIATSGTAFLLTGSETFSAKFQILSTAPTVTTTRIGFTDSATVTEPTDGCWINVADLVLDGKCKNNSGPTATATTYTLSANTWYRATGSLNAAATVFTFALYSEAGAQLWTNTVSANIPTAAGRTTAVQFISTTSASGSAVALAKFDQLTANINRSTQ